MKKLFALALSTAMMLSMVACGSTTPNNEVTPDTADQGETGIQTVSSGKLTVATSPDFAPYEFYAIGEDGTPQLAGFDMALADYIADYLDLELEVIPMDFDGVLMEIANKKVDLGMAGLSPDPDRMNAMDFSDIYYEGGQSFVTVTENKDQFTSLDDVNSPELSIAAQTASIQLKLANKYSADADVIALPKVTDIIAELMTGKLDGAYIETAVAESYKVNYPQLEIVLDVPYDDAAGSSIGVVKGNDNLLAGVNEAIAAALADGSMSRFIAEASELASGETYEGLLDAEGNIQG